MHHTQIFNLKWITDLTVQFKTIKLLEGNIGEIFVTSGKDFLDKTLKAWSIVEYIGALYLCSSCLSCTLGCKFLLSLSPLTITSSTQQVYCAPSEFPHPVLQLGYLSQGSKLGQSYDSPSFVSCLSEITAFHCLMSIVL